MSETEEKPKLEPKTEDEDAANKPQNVLIRADKALEWDAGDPYQRSALHKRNADLLGNELRADIWFHVQQDDVWLPAHRLIVCTASDVLETIAYGTGDIPGAIRDVPVRDCSTADFYEVLRFIYTGIANITANNAADVLALAHYYHLQSLEDECTAKLLSTPLTVRNVCHTFSKMYLLANEPIKRECLCIIRCNTDQLFTANDVDQQQQQNLFDLDVAALRQVFEMDALRLESDVDLFAQLLRWGRDRCMAEEATGTELRTVLEGRLNFVRFAAMTPEQFARCVRMVDGEFFTSDEISTTFRRIAGCKKPPNDDDDKAIGLTHYIQPRKLHINEENVDEIRLSNYRKISEINLAIKCDGKCFLNGIDGFDFPPPAFSVERSDGGGSQNMIAVGIKMYGTCALFDEPIPIMTAVHLKFKFSEEVDAYYKISNATNWEFGPNFTVGRSNSSSPIDIPFKHFLISKIK